MSAVKLISITQPHADDLLRLTPEELIVYVARVSNPSNQLNRETAPKLIQYLIENKHWSPFEMVDMTVGIITSRAIAQQILRHRSFSFQEFSQRYATVSGFEPVQLRYKADKNRQSSSLELEGEDKIYAYDLVNNVLDSAKAAYDKLIERGVAKECARMILPLTSKTTLYMKGSVRSWIHYLQIRCDSHTQLEHREVAYAILDIFKQHFPVISEAMKF
jgi:thymidylate synthase (FAD)